MSDINYIAPLLVSGSFALLLLVFYLYKSENSPVMRILSTWLVKSRRAEIRKDTRGQDAILLLFLIVIILAFGLRVLSFAVVVSDSMKPQFQRGDLVLTQALFKEPNIGDIITFKPVDVQNTITHRVIGIRGDSVTTKGDNNPLPDDYGTTKGDVLAKAIIIKDHPLVVKNVGSYFILDFSREGKLYKFGDQYNFLQQLFMTIRTWGYVITIIAFAMLLMSMGNRR